MRKLLSEKLWSKFDFPGPIRYASIRTQMAIIWSNRQTTKKPKNSNKTKKTKNTTFESMSGFESKDVFLFSLFFCRNLWWSRHVCHLQPTQGLTRRSVRAKMATLQTNSSAHIARASEIITVPKKPRENQTKSRGPVPQNLEKKSHNFREVLGMGEVSQEF